MVLENLENSNFVFPSILIYGKHFVKKSFYSNLLKAQKSICLITQNHYQKSLSHIEIYRLKNGIHNS